MCPYLLLNMVILTITLFTILTKKWRTYIKKKHTYKHIAEHRTSFFIGSPSPYLALHYRVGKSNTSPTLLINPSKLQRGAPCEKAHDSFTPHRGSKVNLKGLWA